MENTANAALSATQPLATTATATSGKKKKKKNAVNEIHAKVLVVGAGIAGTCAAVSAAEALGLGEGVGEAAAAAAGAGAGAAAAGTEAVDAGAGADGAGAGADGAGAGAGDAAGTGTGKAKKKKHVPVLLASKGSVFSGSSFFQGTWGLGLIAPVDSADEEDLAQTILRVGEGVANEELVRSFVAGIRPSIERLKSWGVSLKQASAGAHDQREYIPCFDHKHRAWHGIEREPYVCAMSKRICAAGITVKSSWELLDIDVKARVAIFFVREEGGVSAASQNASAAGRSAETADQSAKAADQDAKSADQDAKSADQDAKNEEQNIKATDQNVASTNQNAAAAAADQNDSAAQSADASAEETCFRAVICSKVAECGKAVEPCFVQVHYDALVLCTGGASSLFSRHLTKDDCCATVQGLAQLAGCQLTNMTFMQFMPGIISPVQGVVFNEKTFRFMALEPRVQEALGGAQETQRLLDLRSTYGPFTCRLESCAIDFAMAQAEKRAANKDAAERTAGTANADVAGIANTASTAKAQGLVLLPRFENVEALPEFVQTYLSWLKDKVGVSENTPLCIGLYAHANNGGISIDQHGYTGIPGIYAAGECTGGMHGADRLGGLSSANGLVFGMRAGESAARFAREAEVTGTSDAASTDNAASTRGSDAASAGNRADVRGVEAAKADSAAAAAPSPSLPAWTRYASPEAAHINRELSRIMDESCMILREKAQVERALVRIDGLIAQLTSSLLEISAAPVALTASPNPAEATAAATAAPPTSAEATATAATRTLTSAEAAAAAATRTLTSAEATAAAVTRTVQLRLLTARAMVEDILRQPQSRGSHYWSN